MAYTVAITNQKGGVGKTTTAVNLAAALAIAERRTLLVDADPQGNTTSGVGISKVELQLSLYDALVEGHPVHDIILSVPGLPYLSLLPATQDLVGAELQLVERPFRESALRRVLEPIEGNYDYIIVDCPPSLGLLTLNVLAAVQALIIPIQCEYYGLEGISQLLNTVRLVQQNINPGLAIGGVLLTMYDSRLNLCRQVAEDATEYFGPKVFGTPIPRNVRLAEAPSFGKPILLYDMQSVGAKSYLAVGQELLRRVEGENAAVMPMGAADHGRNDESHSGGADSGDTSAPPASAQMAAAGSAGAGTVEPHAAEAQTAAAESEPAEARVAESGAQANPAEGDGAGSPTVEAELVDGGIAADSPADAESNGAQPHDHDGRPADAAHSESSGQPGESPTDPSVAREPLGGPAESGTETAISSESSSGAESSDDESARASKPSPESLPGVTT
jgi:chromosome partitioning protein